MTEIIPVIFPSCSLYPPMTTDGNTYIPVVVKADGNYMTGINPDIP